MRLRVLIVSDVRVVQEGLRAVLGRHDGIDVVSTADTRCARDQSTRLQPDVVLFDAARQDSYEPVKDLVAAASGSRVVAFGVKETDAEILALAAAGTAGYIRDGAASADLVRILERVMCDELPCSPRAAASLYRLVATLSPGSGAGYSNAHRICTVPLSRRELQIAHLIDCGLTNKDIARRLGIEAATVKNHVHNICEKLSVHSRGQALARIRAILGARSPLPAALPDAGPAPVAQATASE
jgi:two-component system, NarL family, nitrate/nitrite response regulator NarL